MSSTYVADTPEDQKGDNTLIIIVNNDGTISVDQDAIQNLLANQHNATVSLVRLSGHSQGDDSSQDSSGTSDSQNDGNPHVNLTVEGFYPPSIVTAPAEVAPPTAPEPLVDPFLEMDPEQLERLETALQSEQAKQILGENVTAMLDMLSVDEEASQLKDSIRMDHCYTTLSPSSAPPPTPPPAPSVSNSQYGSGVGAGLDMGFENKQRTTLSSGLGTSFQSQPVARTRGRGRGPGRPRKDPSGARASASFRGGTGRGNVGRGTIKVRRGGTVAGQGSPIVMMQQIKQINPPLAPPPNSPSSASLVPLIKPLVLSSRSTTIPGIRTTLQTISQKQVVTIPVAASGGARFVTLAKASGDQTGQQRVILAPSHGIAQPQQVQIVSASGKQDAVSTDVKKPMQGNTASGMLAGLQDPSKAKVVVAKMPTIPPQLLGTQATSVGHGDSTLQTKDNEADFTDFHQEEESEDDSEDISEEDADTDEDYKNTSSRRRGRGAKSRGGRFYRGARTRGFGRNWEGRGSVRGGRRRGGRGRGVTRTEDTDRAKKLEAEMAAALAAMEKSPDRDLLSKTVNFEKSPQEDIVKKDDTLCTPSFQPSLQTSGRRKVLKVYGKSTKKSVVLESEEVLVQGGDIIVHKKERERTHSTSSVSEKKSPTSKSPVRKQSSDTVQSTSPTPTPTTPPSSSVVIPEARKNYPKRENRKPPAHLAEALGPALFSTPDIIRRVSTGSEQKALLVADTSQEEGKKENITEIADVLPEDVTEKVHEVAPSAEISEQDAEEGPQVSSVEQPVRTEEVLLEANDPKELDTLQPAAKTEEELVADTLLQEQTSVTATPVETEQPNESLGTKLEEVESTTTSEQDPSSPKVPVAVEPNKIVQSGSPALSPATHQVEPSIIVPKLPPATVAITRSSRRRSSTQRSPEPVTKGKQLLAGHIKERRKLEETRARARRRSSEVEDDDDDAQSSGDESWNSEDDPDRLWCICKKPHNNRFMICCDVCEDWFHGKCVGVTKAMGQQMENKGLEWSCPNCSKKKEVEEKQKEEKKQTRFSKDKEVKTVTKDVKRESNMEVGMEATVEVQQASLKESSTEVTNAGEGSSEQASLSDTRIMFCIVCKKEARQSSIYCSDACILKHAKDSLTVIPKEKPVSPVVTIKQPTAKPIETSQPQQAATISTVSLPRARPEARVIVFERKTGRMLSGPNAPTAANLKTWLKDNPTFQVVRPGVLSTKKFYAAKTQASTPKPASIQSKPGAVQQAPTSVQSKVSPPPVPTQAKPAPAQQKAVQPLQKPAVTQQKLLSGAQKPASSLPKPMPVSQKPMPSPQKPTPVQQKPVAIQAKPTGPIIIPSKPMVMKVHKISIPVPTREIQKPGVKTPVAKSPTSVGKPVLKPQSNVNTVTKGPVTSPVNKTAPTTVVSKVPATSTVKEASSSKIIPEKVIVRKVELKRPSSETGKKEEEKEKDKSSGPEPIRLNVRKTLQELLQSRIQECSDLSVSESTVQKIALNIEEEMHAYFRDTGIKYKSKYRSLVFNIKDPKNLTLFRKIADKSVTPHQLVRLSPEELASQELAQWREREAKHQLEMIKKNELDLMSLAKTYVMKTHKGEQVIETDETLKVEVPELVDPSAVPDLASPPNNSVSSTVEDTELDKTKSKSREKSKDCKEKSNKDEKESSRDREKSKHNERKRDRDRSDRSKRSDKESSRKDSHHDGHHDSNRSDHDRRRDRGKSSSRDKHRSSDKSKRDGEKHRNSKSGGSRKEKRDERDVRRDDVSIKKEDSNKEIKDNKLNDVNKDFKKVQVKEEIKNGDENVPNFNLKIEPVDIKPEPQDDSDLSDREPSSTVIIKTPDINVDDGEQSVCATVWKGFVNMPDVAKFFTTVQVVSGDPQNLCRDLPDTVDIVGRIIPDTVWDYISKMKKTGTKEILVIRLTAANDEEKIPYITLYTYLNTRNRLGVVGNVSKMIKDFYIMPLASHNPVPQVLLPLDGPGFEDYRPHLLLGILVRARRKRLAPENEYVAKMPKRLPPVSNLETVERSYTPPLPSAGPDMLGSLTPPHPPPSASDSYTPPHSPQRHFFPGHTGIPAVNSDPRMKWKDSLQETLVGTVGIGDSSCVKVEKPSLESQYSDVDDDDAPYSPGGSDEDNGESSEDNLLMTPKTPSDLQRKVEELNRKIEEQKQQIQSISSAIVGTDAMGAGKSVEPLQVNTIMQSYMLGSNDAHPPASDEGDENEAYSPSRSFTPPPNSIPFIGGTETTSSVLSALPSNISLPSNLHEILASIKKRENDTSGIPAPTVSSKGINLKTDPIVQNYGGRSLDTEPMHINPASDDYAPVSSKPESFSASYVPSTIATSSLSPPDGSPSMLQSASSALLSLSTPVLHPVGTETKPVRDPRQRGCSTPDTTKPSGSTLSSLSDDDLIKKAAEMEMELTESIINTSIVSEKTVNGTKPTTLLQPLPPGVDTLTTVPPPPPPPPVPKSVPVVQPLPPGVEDEEFPSYSASFVPPPPNAPLTIPAPPMGPPPVSYPVPYQIPHHYTAPPSFNVVPPPPPPPPRVTPQGPSYGSTYVSAPPVVYSETNKVNEETNTVSTSKMKRKYQEGELDDVGVKRDRVESPSGGRESWDNKVPVPVRARFTARGRDFIRDGSSSHRGYSRSRESRVSPQHQSRWVPQSKSDSDKNSSHYDAGIRSEWDMHIKEFEEKHRGRLRDSKLRDRSRDRPSSNSQRSSHSSTRSSKNRDSETSGDLI